MNPDHRSETVHVRGETIVIRPLVTTQDCHAAVNLQRDVWGLAYDDLVPATLLHVLDYIGGLAAGAFDASGQMLGFVFGVTGVRDGSAVHWSHMLGVRESARDLGLGRRLKEYQRDWLQAIGVKYVYWTFDPLMAKNAYFNLNRLGANAVEYVPDMYGKTSSPLHLGMTTDRLIVCLATAPRSSSAHPFALSPGSPVLTPFPRLSDPTVSAGDRAPQLALIEIPDDVLGLLERSPSAAKIWRLAVRDHFQWAMSRGYAVAGMHRDKANDRVFYVVERQEAPAPVLAAS